MDPRTTNPGAGRPRPGLRLPAPLKWAFTTRRVDRSLAVCLRDDLTPRAGDLLCARVRRLGHHRRLEDPAGRRRHLEVGDPVVVAFGDRYATDQFEAVVPASLADPVHLAAAGGIAATVVSRHGATRRPTDLEPLGVVCDPSGIPLNLDRFAIPARPAPRHRPPVIAVVGSAMNAGKTATAAALVRGLATAGLAVGAAKVTGTGSGGDLWRLLDAGAAEALDFTDAGLASTWRVPPDELVRVAGTLVAALSACPVVVIEVADGLLQPETAALMVHPGFRSLVDGWVFAAADPLGVVGGLAVLDGLGIDPLCVSGAVTRSPLATGEVRDRVGVPVLGTGDLSDPVVATGLVDLALDGARATTTAHQGQATATSLLDLAPDRARATTTAHQGQATATSLLDLAPDGARPTTTAHQGQATATGLVDVGPDGGRQAAASAPVAAVPAAAAG